MKLVLQRQDYLRLIILSKKINKKSIDEAGLEPNKIQYYKHLVRYYVHEKDLLSASKAYQTIYDTLNKASGDVALISTLDASGADRKSSFQNFILYLLISNFSSEKVDLLQRLESAYPRELEAEPLIAKYVRKMLTYELMPLDENEIETHMVSFEPFLDQTKHNKVHMKEFIR